MSVSSEQKQWYRNGVTSLFDTMEIGLHQDRSRVTDPFLVGVGSVPWYNLELG